MSPFRVVILFILAALISLSILPDLKVSWVPRKSSTSLTINYYVAQASPSLTEQQATATLENALSQIRGVKTISSSSRYNGGNINLIFSEGSDMDTKRFITAMCIRHLYPKLPKGVSYPVISGGSNTYQSQQALLIYSVNGPALPFRVKEEAEDILRKKLIAIPGVSRMTISGTPDIVVSISYNPGIMQAFGLSPADITRAINVRYNISYPGVIHRSNGIELFLRIGSADDKATLRSLEQLIIQTKDGRSIRLKDVATVFLAQDEPVSYFRINGNNSVNLSIYPRLGVNNIVLAQKVRKLIDSASLLLPRGYKVHMAYDDTAYMVKELDKTWTRMVLSAAILLLFILLSYRSWRYLLTLLAGLLVNLALTILGVWLFGIQIHLYTLAGIAISFGLMTDNAIVMIDYFHQYRNRKVFLALLAATLTTVSALMLVFFLPTEERKSLTDFVIIVTIALITSLMTALWFIPGLYHLVFKENAYYRKQHSRSGLRTRIRWNRRYTFSITFLHRYRKLFYMLLILLFGLPVFMLPAKWEGDHWYNKWYNQSLGSDKYLSDIKPFVDKWLGGTLYQFVHKVYERASFRDIRRTRLYVSASLSYGHTPQQMNYLLKYIEEYLKQQKGIDQFITHIYSGQYGTIEITFKPHFENSSLPYMLKSRLIAQSLNQSGADWNIYGVGRGFSNAGATDIPSFRVLMKGYNYDELAHQAEILASLLKQHPRIRKVNTDQQLSYYEKPGKIYVLHFNRSAMALNNISDQQVVSHLHALSKAVYPATNILINHQLYSVLIQAQHADDFSAWQLMHVPLQLAPKHSVNVSNLATLELQSTASAIHKENRQYIRIVGFDYIGSAYFGGQYVKKVLERMKRVLPVGYTAERQYHRWHNSDQTKRKYGLLLIIILASFFICGILFENLKQPFYIITMIPISFIGLFLAFWLFDFNFDQGGYAAFVMLTGLVVNAAIFIVNDFNNLKPFKNSRNRKLIYATCNRARTIMLTIISTCCGLVPFLIGGENEVFWFALAVGTMGGLIFSLFAVFIVLPVLMWKKSRI